MLGRDTGVVPSRRHATATPAALAPAVRQHARTAAFHCAATSRYPGAWERDDLTLAAPAPRQVGLIPSPLSPQPSG